LHKHHLKNKTLRRYKQIRNTIIILFIIIEVTSGKNSAAQSIILPPVWSTERCIYQLINPAIAIKPLAYTQWSGKADTNVLSLWQGGQKSLPQLSFTKKHAYFKDYSQSVLGIQYQRLRFEYDRGTADMYNGNNGAAQLYLDARDNSLQNTGSYNVQAALNRSSLSSMNLEYTLPLHKRTQFLFTLSWLQMNRVQWGHLSGDMNSGQFIGNLDLWTTRGLSDTQAQSNGIAFSMGVATAISKNFHAGIWAENLMSYIDQPAIQHITAQVSTGTVIPDENNFLHAAPILEGQVTQQSYAIHVRERWNLAAAFQQDRGNWLIVSQNDPDWRIGGGYARNLGKNQHIWLLLYPVNFEGQLGLETGQIKCSLGADSLNWHGAQRCSLSFEWILPIR
jgi:hypothetical protein